MRFGFGSVPDDSPTDDLMVKYYIAAARLKDAFQAREDVLIWSVVYIFFPLVCFLRFVQAG